MTEPKPDSPPSAGLSDQGAAAGTPTQEERTWGMLVHLSAFAGLVFPLVGNIVGPLIVWQVRRDQSAFVAEQGKEALNFNISVSLCAMVCAMLLLIFIGVLLAAVLTVYWLVMTIVAAIKASEGVAYRYPLAVRLIK